MSTPGVPVTEQEKAMNREAEKQLREVSPMVLRALRLRLTTHIGEGQARKASEGECSQLSQRS